ncbi:uncharacterized protein LOC106081093 [Stomoxys calcitrans]|uniref:Uncharacterized protein n=1 Tax=Stomoxys calcitrans TaxID=35570 RepID=A0A1I8NZQ6_STOCA|nr:uncharacterized protein LOC106081093 [Stomoxys calcitrans]
MKILRQIPAKIHRFFQWYYPHIMVSSLVIAMLTKCLQINERENSHNINFWINLYQKFNNNPNNLKFWLSLAFLLFQLLLVWWMFICWCRPLRIFSHGLSQLEVKRLYTKFILFRLVTELSDIEDKYLRCHTSEKNFQLQSFIAAHDEMTRAIWKFRKDVRQVLAPNEQEIALPIENVYGLAENEKKALEHSKFYKMPTTAIRNLIQKIMNP